jgi:hypothetical protein
MPDHDDDDDKTPARRRDPEHGGPDAADIANTGLALATVATRLRHCADLADAAARRCSEAARMGEEFSAQDRSTALRDSEHELETLAEAVHDTRRAMRDARRDIKGRH